MIGIGDDCATVARGVNDNRRIVLSICVFIDIQKVTVAIRFFV